MTVKKAIKKTVKKSVGSKRIKDIGMIKSISSKNFKSSKIIKTPYYSIKINNLANGCKECVLGKKTVIFVTGLCPKSCFYCPLSDQKKNKDVIYVNERKLENENDFDAIIEEVKACGSIGAGMTGGDPLVKIDRTVKYIGLLKKTFGKKFHIHLYTSPEVITKEKLDKLSKAGLDELRLHPDIINNKDWNKISLFYNNIERKYSFDLGVEIPLLTGYKTDILKLIDYFLPKIDFINLNELEISDTNACKLVEKKFHAKNNVSYGVEGSEKLGKEFLKYISKKYPQANVHYCSCKLKDAVQLRNRLKLRAKNTARIFDIITPDGTLVRGAIYFKDYAPGFSYRKNIEKISSIEKRKIIFDLAKFCDVLVDDFSIPEKYLEIDAQKLRIITNVGIVKKLKKYLNENGLIGAIVEQYPTYDQMEVDVDFI